MMPIPIIYPGAGKSPINDIEWLRWMAKQDIAPSAQKRMIEIADRYDRLIKNIEEIINGP